MIEQEIKRKAAQLLGALTQAHGAPGSESAIRAIVRSELGDGVRADRTGNLVYTVEGRSRRPRVMLTAHMDEVGFLVHSIDRAGLIKFVPLGGWWSHALLAQRVRIRTRTGTEVVGVIGAKPPHFLEAAEREKVIPLDRMTIDVGAASDEEARERFGIRIGDPIVPESSCTPLANPDVLLGKAFDNRVGVGLLLLALQSMRDDPERHPNTIAGVATVQEEVGTRGAQTAVRRVDPDVAIVLEGTPADDHPDVREDQRQGVLNGGVQIRWMDPSAIMNRRLVDLAADLAEGAKIKHQLAVRKSGGTDAKVIHLHAEGVPTLVLGVPARYIHTHNSMIHLDDFVATLQLVVRLLNALDQETVAGLIAY